MADMKWVIYHKVQIFVLVFIIWLLLAACSSSAPTITTQSTTPQSISIPSPTSTPTQTQPSITPTQPQPTYAPNEILSWFKPELYTGITSTVCKVPVTDITGLTAAEVRLAVNADKSIGKLDHAIWSNLGGAGAYGNITYEYNQAFWELNRFTGIFQYVRLFGIFNDGIPNWKIEEAKKLLLEGKLTVYPSGLQAPAESYYYGCQIYSEDDNGKPKYNFWHLDYVLDTILSAGIKPVVQCGFMPDALADGDKQRAHEAGLINTPKDYSKWRDLIYNTVKHCIERYGAEEVRSWYFVLWNEPDSALVNGSYFIKEQDAFPKLMKMYDFFADGAKAADSLIKVGGTELMSQKWFKPFLAHCASGNNEATGKNGAPLDVISWHEYGTTDNLLINDQTLLNIIKQFSSFKDCTTLVTEWGQDLMGTDQQGKLVAEPNKEEQYTSFEAANLCKYIDGSLIKSGTQSPHFFRSGSATKLTAYYRYYAFSYQRYFVPMPVLNAYLLLGKMGNDQVELSGSLFGDTVHGFAARTENGVQVLLYNFNEADKKNEGKTVEVDLSIMDLKADWSKMRRYQIDKQNSNAWIQYPVDKQATSTGQVATMETDSRLKIIEQTDKLENKDGKITFRLSMPANSVSLIVIGEEALPLKMTQSQHITRVLKEEASYNLVISKLDKGDMAGAKAGFEQLAVASFNATTNKSSNNPYSFWGQKALYALVSLAEKQRDFSYADKVRVQLLSTTLTDVERFVLLNERLKYLESINVKDTIQALTKEIQSVRSKLEYYANWSKWANYWGEGL